MNLDFNFNFNFNLSNKKNLDIPKNLTFKEFLDYINFQEFTPYEKQIEMAEFIVSGDTPRLLLGYRHIAKTLLCTILGTLYYIYQDNSRTVLIVGATFQKAKDILYEISGYLQANPELFGGFASKGIGTREVRNLANKKKEQTIAITGLDGVFRGGHPNLIIFDDPLTMENSHQKLKREKVKIKYGEAYKLSKNIAIIGQPTHALDLYQQLRVLESIDKMEVWNGDIKGLEADLHAMARAGVSQHSINANYLGILESTESLPLSNIKVMDTDLNKIKNIDNAVAYYDYARGESAKSDYNALSIIFLRDFKIYVLGYAKRTTWANFTEETALILNKLGVRLIAYENNTTGSEPEKIFLKHGLYALGRATTTHKTTKIQQMYGLVDNIIMLRLQDEHNAEYIRQIKEFEEGGRVHDDAPDSLVMGLVEMNLIERVK